MRFRTPLTEAILLRRVLRFLAEVSLGNHKKRTIYCPNLNPLLGCDILGSRIWFSNSGRLSRGYLDVWELVEVNGGHLVSIHPEHSRTLLREAIETDQIPELKNYRFLQALVQNSGLRSGIDILTNQSGEHCFICIEHVTLADDRGEGFFPEIPYTHSLYLRELMALKEAGHRALLFFCAANEGIQCIRPGESIDPEYGKLLRNAFNMGVETLAYRTKISEKEMSIDLQIPIILSENILYR